MHLGNSFKGNFEAEKRSMILQLNDEELYLDKVCFCFPKQLKNDS